MSSSRCFQWMACLVFVIALAHTAFAQPPAPTYLRCEYLVNPLGIEVTRPRFSWELTDERRGAIQTAYEVQVWAALRTADAAPARREVWSTGKVLSSDTCQVEYSGDALTPSSLYEWRVRTWDGLDQPSAWSEPAAFTTGLMSDSAWNAKWIGDATPAPQSVRANNGFHSEFANQPTDPKWVQIDLGEDKTFDAVRLWPARPYDFAPDTTGFCFPLQFWIQTATHAEPENWRTVYESPHSDLPRPGTDPVTISFDPATARYVRLLLTSLRAATPGKFAVALAEMEVIAGTRVLSTGAAVKASDSIETGAWSTTNLTDADTVSHNAGGWEALPAPMLRKRFSLPNDARHATLSITALGVYEARINGQRVGTQQLAPEWTDYHTRVQYQTYDVTSMLRAGDNAIGVMLGDGWYAGRLGMAQQFTPDRRPRGVYGRQPRLLARLHVTLNDGSHQLIATDGSWSSTLRGPVRSADLLDGEVYDARAELKGWDLADASTDANTWSPVLVDESIKVAVVSQPNEPIRERDTRRPISMTEPRPGVFVFDLGQNMPGWCRITVTGEAGATVTLRHAEAVNDDGTIYTTNLRGAPQIDQYTLRGDPAGETWEPRFTYHGFRFVEWTATGKVARPTLDSLLGVVVCSDPPLVGTFDCSNPMLNQLWSNVLWTQHANMMSVPTDCPQRDERLGWMGDILAFAPSACFNKDMAAFLAKWSGDVRDAQADDGRFPDVAPHPYGKNDRFTGVPAWGDAGVFVPWTSYLFYADTRLLREHYAASKRWVDWIESKNPDLLWKNARHNDYNDWLNGDTLIQEGWPRAGASIPNEVFATAFFARSTWIVSEMARVLGESDDHAHYTDLHSRIRNAFISNYVAPDAAMPGDTQAGYAIALAFDLLPPTLRPAAIQQLLAGIDAYKGHLSTGFHSTHHAMIELTSAGYSGVAHQIAAKTTFPSWGYSIENGATTIWERWDGYVKGRGFQDPGMNSLNHWALGSVAEWMMRAIVGINLDDAAPGWRRSIIAPRPGGNLTHASGSYRSIRGTIRSAWRRDADTTTFDIVIPPNTSAQVRLPGADPSRITESGQPLDGHPHAKILRTEPAAGSDGAAIWIQVPAGRFTFVVREM